jgi:hypothetical protein
MDEKNNEKARHRIHAVLDEFLDEDDGLNRLINKVGNSREQGHFTFKVTLKYDKNDDLQILPEGDMRQPKYKQELAGEILNGQLTFWS